MATVYVRAGDSGSGSSWSDALGTPPNPIARGDTVYIADGDYGVGLNLTAAESATTDPVETLVQKATIASHGDSTGWLDEYGDGVAKFGQLVISTGYHTIDGVVGGFDQADMSTFFTGHGFQFVGDQFAADPDDRHSSRILNDASNISIYRCDIGCESIVASGNGTRAMSVESATSPWPDYGNASKDILLSRCYLHHSMGSLLYLKRCDGIVCEYTGFSDRNTYDVPAGGEVHGSVIAAIGCTNIVNRYFYYDVTRDGLTSWDFNSGIFNHYDNFWYPKNDYHIDSSLHYGGVVHVGPISETDGITGNLGGGGFVGHNGSATNLHSGTAEAGGANTIQLEGNGTDGTGYANASNYPGVTGDDSLFYVGCYIELTGGTGSGQWRQITAFDPFDGTCTVDSAWDTQPDDTTTYTVSRRPNGKDIKVYNCTIVGVLSASTANAKISGGVYNVDDQGNPTDVDPNGCECANNLFVEVNRTAMAGMTPSYNTLHPPVSDTPSPSPNGIGFVANAQTQCAERNFASWSRSGTVVTVTHSSHGHAIGSTVSITNTTEPTGLPNGDYVVQSRPTSNTYTLTRPDSGATSGLCTSPATEGYEFGTVDRATMFVDADNDDFNLVAADSAGAAGKSLTPIAGETLDVDMFGVPRSTWTRGAIEFGLGTDAPVTTSASTSASTSLSSTASTSVSSTASTSASTSVSTTASTSASSAAPTTTLPPSYRMFLRVP